MALTECNPEDPHLIPDAQVNGVVFLPENHLTAAHYCNINEAKHLYLII